MGIGRVPNRIEVLLEQAHYWWCRYSRLTKLTAIQAGSLGDRYRSRSQSSRGAIGAGLLMPL